MPRRIVTIGQNDAGQRLDKFLTKTYPNLPQSVLYKCIRTKDVKRNGKRCQRDDRLQEGDELSLYWQEEFFQDRSQGVRLSKGPQGPVHRLRGREHDAPGQESRGSSSTRTRTTTSNSLIARVQHYLYDKGEYDPQGENAFAPALVNRIDRNTGGIVLAAKNAEALRILNQKVKDRELVKLYLCVVCGRLSQKEGLLTGYLEKNEAQNRVYILKKPKEGAKAIRTKYRVLAEKRDFSLLEVELLTGRTHQIRAHFASIGHPLAGDGKYGKNAVNKGTGFPYQALVLLQAGVPVSRRTGACSSTWTAGSFSVEDRVVPAGVLRHAVT